MQKLYAEEKIKIGLLVPLSGKQNKIGKSIMQSIQLAANKIDNSNIVILPKDTQNDPIKTLDNWWKLVKPGGYLIVIVPHEDLYEQFIWPSIFSDNHNSSFRLNDKNLWSPVSINIVEACKKLYNYEVIKFEKHDKNYDYDLLFPKNIKPKKEIPFLVKKLKRIGKKFKKKHIKKKNIQIYY